MRKHTPGPWSVYSAAKDDGFTDFYGIDGPDLDKGNAVVLWDPSGGIENEANARLIAAAPELLAACEVMSAHYSGSLDHQPAYVKLARAAIAKATGTADD
jgi:hypothetical protein